MAFLALGLVFVVLKLGGWTAVAQWSWWWVLAPFAAAAVWWQIADATGMTRRRAEAREARRKRMRQETAYEALDPLKKRR